ncbi:MAG: TOBE domain-containing protein, partial [Chloroflexota bacterium]
FIGLTNIFEGVRQGELLKTEIGAFPFSVSRPKNNFILIRPESANLNGQGNLQLKGTLISQSFRGSFNRLKIEINQQRLEFDFPANIPLQSIGSEITLFFQDIEQSVQYLQDN